MELPPFSFDFDAMIYTRDGESIELSKTEQRLLRLLVENRGQTLTREQLLDRIWDGGAFVDENALSVAVRRPDQAGGRPRQNSLRSGLYMGGSVMERVLLLAALLSLGFGGVQWYARRRDLRRLDEMLTSAINGSFQEGSFDESAVSALEVKMARFLTAPPPPPEIWRRNGRAIRVPAGRTSPTRPRPPSPISCSTPPCWQRSPSLRNRQSRFPW